MNFAYFFSASPIKTLKPAAIVQELKDAAASATSKENSRKSSGNENEAKILGLFSDSHHYIKLYENLKSVFMVQRNSLDRNDKVINEIFQKSLVLELSKLYLGLSRSILVYLKKRKSVRVMPWTIQDSLFSTYGPAPYD